MQLFRDNLDRGTNRVAEVNTYVGGPIVRDAVWYALSGSFVDVTSTLPRDPNFSPTPRATSTASTAPPS